MAKQSNPVIPEQKKKDPLVTIFLLLVGLAIGTALCMASMVFVLSLFGFFTLGKISDSFTGLIDEAIEEGENIHEDCSHR